MADPNTITGKIGFETKGAKQDLDDLKRHTDSWAKSLFGQEPTGERRMRGFIAGATRDLSSMQGGAQGAAQAMSMLFSRLSTGAGVGAILVGVGEAMNRMVQRGAELNKESAEINRQMHEMARSAQMTTAATPFTSLMQGAREFQQTHRHMIDESAKDQEHFARTASTVLFDVFRHPFRGGWLPDAIRKAQEELRQQHAVPGEKAEELRVQQSDKAVQSLRLQAQLHETILKGTTREVEEARLNLEYMQRLAEIEVLLGKAKDAPRRQAATAALDQEFSARRKLADVRQAQEESSTAAALKESQMAVQSAQANARVFTQEEKRYNQAVQSLQLAKAETAEAEHQVELAKNLNAIEQQRAETNLNRARARQAQAEREAQDVETERYYNPTAAIQARTASALERERRKNLPPPGMYEPGTTPTRDISGRYVPSQAYQRSSEAYGGPGEPSGHQYVSQLDKHLTAAQTSTIPSWAEMTPDQLRNARISDQQTKQKAWDDKQKEAWDAYNKKYGWSQQGQRRVMPEGGAGKPKWQESVEQISGISATETQLPTRMFKERPENMSDVGTAPQTPPAGVARPLQETQPGGMWAPPSGAGLPAMPSNVELQEWQQQDPSKRSVVMNPQGQGGGGQGAEGKLDQMLQIMRQAWAA